MAQKAYFDDEIFSECIRYGDAKNFRRLLNSEQALKKIKNKIEFDFVGYIDTEFFKIDYLQVPYHFLIIDLQKIIE